MDLSKSFLSYISILLLILTVDRVFANINSADQDSPMETQNAQCTIKAGNIEASAQASVSKKLEGICGTNQMKTSFEIIEARLMYEINQLKAMIYILLPNTAANYNAFTYASPYNQPVRHPSVYPINANSYEHTVKQTSNGSQNYTQSTNIPQIQHPTSTEHPIIFKTTTKSAMEPLSTASTRVPTTTTESIRQNASQMTEIKAPAVAEKILEFKPVQTKSLNRNRSKHHKPGPRDFEVHKFNNTLLSGGEIRIFTYYWRFENFTSKLKSNASYIYSPIFSISGLNLRVKATLNHLNRDYLYLQLESVPHAVNEDVSSNIILETGDMFKEIETRKFFRHKIVIMDQGTPTSDLISQEFLNTKSGFPVPNSAVKSPPYAKNDNILIKIVIFL
ncbi:hypothetical protein Bhyg_02357 [Pseudolycoriella hygida]|uniref:Uncharacterized protein n=1 Tax=Pseudolycoriella hygida TaxID=35572 RepID=A0A9Q0S6F4_9DIPT|nr:hypothetical protein Bhyg_02357 [Pseudolycoriella hygida]